MNSGDLPTDVAFDESFDALVGFTYEHIGATEVTGHFDVRPELLDRNGVVSLGVFTAVAEGAASMGTASVVVPQGMAASGLSNDTTVTEPVSDGRVAVLARRRSEAADLWIWDVEARRHGGELCAVSKVLIAVRPLR